MTKFKKVLNILLIVIFTVCIIGVTIMANWYINTELQETEDTIAAIVLTIGELAVILGSGVVIYYMIDRLEEKS